MVCQGKTGNQTLTCGARNSRERDMKISNRKQSFDNGNQKQNYNQIYVEEVRWSTVHQFVIGNKQPVLS
jgi:hypothetical protein